MRRSPPELFAQKPKRDVAYAFALDALSALDPSTRAMFGATAVYIEDKVVFILRHKGDADDGVWVAYEPEREAEALAALPRLVPIGLFGTIRGWKKLAAHDADFEADVLAACALLRDPACPIGKVPTRTKKKSAPRATKAGAAKKGAAKKGAAKKGAAKG